ncbi:MAG TPA: 5-methyltetrahydropteroyltriglutamate--homocysteine S-methyltransferase, partial [Aquella sp.]|nr:5-methyltetrahydropteroyltriglutamate--homocysteine S-methyltransferase [Aquella sp.]
MAKTHILGFPRIGANRELKKALESYWRGEIGQNVLLTVGREIRQKNWKIQADAGFDFVTVGDFSFYDHILDTSALLGVIPPRYEHNIGKEVDLDTVFTMARGQAPGKKDTTALAMTKWFNTNYHYMVPEFKKDQQFVLSSNKLFNEIKEAVDLGHKVKPVLVGPLTYLWSGKEKEAGFSKLDLLPQLI